MINANPTRDKLNRFGRVSICGIHIGEVGQRKHNATIQLAQYNLYTERRVKYWKRYVMRLLITGANGHLGTRLIRRINIERPGDEIVAVVRSERAAAALQKEGLEVDIRVVSYTDSAGLNQAGQGAEIIVHLVGIIKESAANTFEMAHENTSTALVAANLDARHIVTLGILGSGSASPNGCFRSRAASDAILQAGPIPTSVIRVPMVLGPGDYASSALAKNGRSGLAFCFRSSSLEQPIYSMDVIDAIVAAVSLAPENRIIELAGPESLMRKALIERAGKLLGNKPTVISLPLAPGYLLAWIIEKVSSNPPVTRAMLGVLDHDDAIDTSAATNLLGLTLTPLDEVLRNVLTD